jgi:uncharacterized protein (DUF362 family)
MAEETLWTDMGINLPKLKMHSRMLLPPGVKNCFGCIAGYRKAEWHMRTGVNDERFARLLVQTDRVVKPALTILDGIIALEGRGGSPRHPGALMASDGTLAVDVTVMPHARQEPGDAPDEQDGPSDGAHARPHGSRENPA